LPYRRRNHRARVDCKIHDRLKRQDRQQRRQPDGEGDISTRARLASSDCSGASHRGPLQPCATIGCPLSLLLRYRTIRYSCRHGSQRMRIDLVRNRRNEGGDLTNYRHDHNRIASLLARKRQYRAHRPVCAFEANWKPKPRLARRLSAGGRETAHPVCWSPLDRRTGLR
jgi:hypothetical protein